MSEIIAIVGQTGTGKSTSIEPLDPKETVIIGIIDKQLPFRGWKQKYQTGIQQGGNFLVSHNSDQIVKALNYISESRQEIKQIVIDDFQYIMSTEFMNRATETGWQKFTDIAKHVWDVINAAKSLREDLKVFILSHDEIVTENFQPKRKIKTIGKLLDDKVTLEGLFTIVLYTDVQKNKEKDGFGLEYSFITQNDGTTTAKSPKGMFETLHVPNNLADIITTINAYYEGN
ncbi:MAG: AAA family ATPase [Anaerolineales bacterium]|nr:AAA family ATPase [Anaerolineales bacterium]